MLPLLPKTGPSAPFPPQHTLAFRRTVCSTAVAEHRVLKDYMRAVVISKEKKVKRNIKSQHTADVGRTVKLCMDTRSQPPRTFTDTDEQAPEQYCVWC